MSNLRLEICSLLTAAPMSRTASTVNRLQSDSNVRTHVHFSWSQRTTSSHAQSRLQSPKASDKNNLKKKIAEPAAILLPSDSRLTEKHTRTHARTREKQGPVTYSCLSSAGVKTLSLGFFFFFFCLTAKPCVCTHPCGERERGIFRDELLAQANMLYCLKVILKKGANHWESRGGGGHGASEFGIVYLQQRRAPVFLFLFFFFRTGEVLM